MCRSGHLSLVAIFGVLLLGGTHALFRLLAGSEQSAEESRL
jgi:hypothetical protein